MELYAVEKSARGSPPDERRAARQAQARPIFDDLENWLDAQLPDISGKSPLVGAIRYALTRMKHFRPYLDYGILEIDNNPAERAMRPIALGRKTYLFVGSQTGGKAAAVAYTLTETAKPNDTDPHKWMADTLARIPDYKFNKVETYCPGTPPEAVSPDACGSAVRCDASRYGYDLCAKALKNLNSRLLNRAEGRRSFREWDRDCLSLRVRKRRKPSCHPKFQRAARKSGLYSSSPA